VHSGAEKADVSTLASAALGLLALLIAFSFSMALSRYERRRDMVLEEANAIGSTANFTLMLPPSAQRPILSLLREYTAVRVALGVPYDSQKMGKDIARSLDIQARLWQQAAAVATAEPQSLPAYLFVSSLNEINNIHEKRLTALRNHVPVVVVLMLIGSAMVAMGFTGYNAGVTGAQRHLAGLIMSIMIAALIVLVIDLDRPYRGLIQDPHRHSSTRLRVLGRDAVRKEPSMQTLVHPCRQTALFANLAEPLDRTPQLSCRLHSHFVHYLGAMRFDRPGGRRLLEPRCIPIFAQRCNSGGPSG
jgi:hypothetical protein